MDDAFDELKRTKVMGDPIPSHVQDDEARAVLKRSTQFFGAAVFPERDGKALIERLKKVMGTSNPETPPKKPFLEPSITVPLIDTVQRALSIDYQTRVRLQHSLFMATEWRFQDPSEQVLYIGEKLADGSLRVRILDLVALESGDADGERFPWEGEGTRIELPPSALDIAKRGQMMAKSGEWGWMLRVYTICMFIAFLVSMGSVLDARANERSILRPLAVRVAFRLAYVILATTLGPLYLLYKAISSYKIVPRNPL